MRKIESIFGCVDCEWSLREFEETYQFEELSGFGSLREIQRLILSEKVHGSESVGDGVCFDFKIEKQ